MENNTNPTSVDEILLDPEDVKKLKKIMDTVQASINNLWEKLPQGLQALIHAATLEPNLRENLPDQIAITITFCMQIQSPTFSALMKPNKVFYVECLSPNIESLVEERFQQTTRQFLEDFCHFLYTSADTIHDLLNQ